MFEVLKILALFVFGYIVIVLLYWVEKSEARKISKQWMRHEAFNNSKAANTRKR